MLRAGKRRAFSEVFRVNTKHGLRKSKFCVGVLNCQKTAVSNLLKIIEMLDEGSIAVNNSGGKLKWQ